MKIDQYVSRYMDVGQVRIHYKVAGPDHGETVILLHGFPEFWYGWRRQIPALSAAGYRVVVPDQRGYNLSYKPQGVKSYDIDLLAGDVLGLIDHLGVERVHLAGHDWGAAVAWWVAMHHPQRLKSLAIMNVPHPYIMLQNIFRNPAQRRKSWYIFFFQLPRLPEWLMGRDQHHNAARMLQRTSLPGSFLPDDIIQYQSAWSQPGAWTGTINWYRAIRLRASRIPPTMVEVPTLIIWGQQDAALEAVMARQSLDFCRDGRLEAVPEATHWVQLDAADTVNDWLIGFFG